MSDREVTASTPSPAARFGNVCGDRRARTTRGADYPLHLGRAVPNCPDVPAAHVLRDTLDGHLTVRRLDRLAA